MGEGTLSSVAPRGKPVNNVAAAIQCPRPAIPPFQETVMSRLNLAIEQIAFARAYTVRLLDHVPEEDWFRIPPAGVSHIAWQVGHLAMAQYRLALFRTRGERPGDGQLISPEFLRTFGKDSTPDPDPAKYPSLREIRAVFDRIHAALMEELPALPGEELDAPVLAPHSLVQTKLWALLWCAQHEMLHAGQIGLLRRQLGHAPVW
jgi:hypothetical protein